MAHTLRGTTAALQQSIEIISDPTRGKILVTHWQGLNFDQINQLGAYYDSIGVGYKFEQKFGVYDLVAEDATANNPIDNWELVGNDERLDIFQHPTILTLLSNYDGDKIMAAVRQGLDANTAYEELTNPDLDVLSDADDNTLGQFYFLYQKGTTEFENDAYGGGYVLRHTTNVPNRWINNVADFNVGQVYSAAELLTEITSTARWIFPCPSGLVFAINNIPVPAAQAGYFWGWKKQRSSRETVARNRVNITQHYVLELWSTHLYVPFP